MVWVIGQRGDPFKKWALGNIFIGDTNSYRAYIELGYLAQRAYRKLSIYSFRRILLKHYKDIFRSPLFMLTLLLLQLLVDNNGAVDGSF